MTELTRDDILNLASLSKLDLTEEEIVEFQEELSGILRYVEMLQKVKLDKLEPTNQVSGLSNVFRADEIKDYGYTPDELLVQVPELKDNLIKVRRILT